MLSQLSLADTCRTNEEEAANRTVAFIKACTVTADSPSHRFHSLVLANDLGFETVIHALKTLNVASAHLRDRHSRHPLNRLCYIVDCRRHLHILGVVLNFLFQLFNAGLGIQSCFIIFFLNSCFLLSLLLSNLTLNRVDIGYWMLGCQVGSSHIDQVNRLVWQTPLWNILNRIIYSRFQHFIRQDDIVVLFV
ncbi:hypothetical protein STRDD04_01099 [Streptococcus sp. DD04]|nr:hypothetical protein STRDD04_01099 [Streptococcus sp. DD04]